MGLLHRIFERNHCSEQSSQGCNSGFCDEVQSARSSCNQGRCDSTPSNCRPQSSLDMTNPYKRAEVQSKGLATALDGKAFGEDNVLDALSAAKANGKPILAMTVGSEGLSEESKANLNTLKNDYNIVVIDRANANQKMNAGLPTNEFWALANLMGCKGDVNNIKDNYMGTFSSNDLAAGPSKFGMKPSGESTDAKTALKELAKGVQKPDPLPDVNANKDVPKSGPKSDKPASTNGPLDPFDFNQGRDKIKPASATTTDPFDFNQGSKLKPLKPGEQPVKPNMPAELHLPAFPDFKPLAPYRPSDNAQPKERPDQRPEVKPEVRPEVRPDSQPVKLDQVKFDTDNVEKAFQLAREKNLPVIVYKGADFCHNCPPVSHAIDNLSNTLKNAPTTEAIVVKLNYERAMQLQRENPALAAQINKLMPLSGSSFPDVKLYNPNDTSKPIQTTNGYGGDASFLRSLVQTGKTAMASEKPVQPVQPVKHEELKPFDIRPDVKPVQPLQPKPFEVRPDVKPENPGDRPAEKVKLDKMKFSDADFSNAIDIAKKNNLPVVVYMGADFCHYCPAAHAKINQTAANMANAPETKAVVVTLTYEKAEQLARRNDENARLLKQVMSHGSSVPRLSVYNANDLGSPVTNQTVGNISQSGMDSLVQSSIEKVRNARPNTVRSSNRPQANRRY